MEEKLRKLTELVSEVMDIDHSIALLGWDEQVNMPSGGAEERGYMMGTLGKIAHEKFSSDEMGKLLDELKIFLPELDPDGESYRIISVTARDYEKMKFVPASFVSEKARVTSVAQHAWLEAREKSDFSVFLPHLEKIIELCHQYISYFPVSEHPYDVLLDDYEPGMKTSEIKKYFDELLPHQVDLIRSIGERPQIEDSFLHLKYDQDRMWNFSNQIATAFGYDWNRGRQDPTTHPFCQSIGPDDVRITSRWVPDLPFALLFGTMHETGHALYEQGVGHTWSRTSLEGGASLGIHESQSRMWENLIGRSRAFWQYFYPMLQDSFRTQLGNVNLDQFYRAINKVSPSLIRVEADEATYNLHIMLRFELETAIFEGKIKTRDLPGLWNQKMKDYLGVSPTNDVNGILQDIHWSGGMFGYFPTYALGNLISVQLLEKFKKLTPELDSQIERGDFSSLLSWTRVKIHQFGRKYEPQELIHRITQNKIDTMPYLNYLKTKYNEIYDLDFFPVTSTL
jgi:carboxypeptidase Taq